MAERLHSRRSKENQTMSIDHRGAAARTTQPSRVAWLAVAGLATLALLLAIAGEARASLAIESFTTSSSDHTAGGHPDLSTSFTIAEPGVHEAARNVVFEAPEGIFGNPYAITHCASSDFALDQCPPDAQAGLITVYANYENEEHHLLGTAPIFDLEPHGGQTALFAPSSCQR